jgi:Tfp pilus assembly protein PilP
MREALKLMIGARTTGALTLGVVVCLGAGNAWPQTTTPPATQTPAPSGAKPGVPPAQAVPPPGAPAPAQPGTPRGPDAQASPTPPAAQPPEAYSYSSDGRRDPFVSLISRGAGDLRGSANNRPEGREGLLVNDVTVKGIVKTPRGYIAMITGADNKTYIVHQGERLFDGTIQAIAEDVVVFLQEINDPLSLVKQREVRKPLRALQEGK